jgi:hypothetical protein
MVASVGLMMIYTWKFVDQRHHVLREDLQRNNVMRKKNKKQLMD